jgi:sodium transport system permease protein
MMNTPAKKETNATPMSTTPMSTTAPTSSNTPAGTTQRSGLLAVIKKEFKRFFTDQRMVLTTLLLPGLIIFVIYSFMGNALSSIFTVDEDYMPIVYAVNLPSSIEALGDSTDLPIQPLPADEIDIIKELIAEKEVDLLVIFPENFDATVERAIAEGDSSQSTPQVEIYYNSTRPESGTQYGRMGALLDGYKTALMPLFSVNADGGTYDLVTEKDRAGFTFSLLLPLLIIMMLYTGCTSIAPESIAGEKERGTIATMLVTPLARWELALGKVVSLGVIALLSGMSSFIGIMLSLPRMMGSMGGDEGSINAAVYNVGDYAMLLAVILSTVLVFVGIIAVISAFARSVKEAGTLVTPLMIIVMLVGVLGMFSQTAATEPWLYLIPAYNSVQSMTGIFSFSADPLLVCITIAANVVVSVLCVFVLTRMFNSERVMFAR